MFYTVHYINNLKVTLVREVKMGKEEINAIVMSVVMAMLLIVVNSALVVPVNAQPTEWHVYPGDSIQATVDAAEDGDIIYVHPGYSALYDEEVRIDKCVTIIRMEVQTELDGNGKTAGKSTKPFAVGNPNVFVIPASTDWTILTLQKTEESPKQTLVEGVPVLTPLGIMALIGLLSIVVAVRTRKRR